MPKYAVCTGYTATMNTDEETTLNLDVSYFDTDGEQVVGENASVPTVIDPDGLLSNIHANMVNAIQEYADSELEWTVSATRVIHPQVAKGLL